MNFTNDSTDEYNSVARLLDSCCSEKLETHLGFYAEDMLNYAKYLSKSNLNLRQSVWAIEDRAFGSLLVFPPHLVELIIKGSPLIANTRVAEFDLDHVAEIPISEQEKLKFYHPIKLLLTIIANSNDILEMYKESNVAPRSFCSRLAEDVKAFSEWALKNYPKHQAVKSKKISKKNVASWFVGLCGLPQIDTNQTARNMWNQIKSLSSPVEPIEFEYYQIIIHDDKMFYSKMHLSEKEWSKYFTEKKADKITYKTFRNYLSEFKQSQKYPEF